MSLTKRSPGTEISGIQDTKLLGASTLVCGNGTSLIFQARVAQAQAMHAGDGELKGELLGAFGTCARKRNGLPQRVHAVDGACEVAAFPGARLCAGPYTGTPRHRGVPGDGVGPRCPEGPKGLEVPLPQDIRKDAATVKNSRWRKVGEKQGALWKGCAFQGWWLR